MSYIPPVISCFISVSLLSHRSSNEDIDSPRHDVWCIKILQPLKNKRKRQFGKIHQEMKSTRKKLNLNFCSGLIFPTSYPKSQIAIFSLLTEHPK